MIQKTISIICDGCGCTIDHFPGYTKAEAIAVSKDGGAIIKGKNHFCDEICERVYIKALKKGQK